MSAPPMTGAAARGSSGAHLLVIEHQGNAGPGFFGRRLTESGARITTAGPETGRALPDSLDGYDGLIVLGGSMGPRDDADAPWLPGARRLLSEGVERGVPTLGICLGAQLLAVARGGNVREIPSGPEIGVAPVRFSDRPAEAAEDPVFGALAGREVPAVQWHYLEIDVLPSGSLLLASNAHSRHQAYRVGASAWGVQFHPEAVAATLEDWSVEDAEELKRLGRDPATIGERGRRAEPELLRIWGDLAERFARLADERRRGDQPAA